MGTKNVKGISKNIIWLTRLFIIGLLLGGIIQVTECYVFAAGTNTDRINEIVPAHVSTQGYISSSTPRQPVTLTVDDPQGDTPRDFIDIIQGSVTSEGSNLTTRIKLANLPAQLLFNKEGNLPGFKDYSWLVMIDADNNPLTGDHYGNEYVLELFHYKIVNENQHYGSLDKEKQCSVTYYDVSTGKVYYGNWIVDIDYQTHIITMVTTLHSAISSTSKISLITQHFDGNERYADTAPDNLFSPTLPVFATPTSQRFSLVVDDPTGDVSQSYADITQGRITVDGTNLIVNITLKNLPSPNLSKIEDSPKGTGDYMWEVWIDADNNPLTGDLDGNEYQIILGPIQSQDLTQLFDSINSGTSPNSVYMYNVTTTTYQVDHSISAKIDYDTRTLTLLAPLHASIMPSARLTFEAYYHQGTLFEWDKVPDLPVSGNPVKPEKETTFVGSLPLPGQISTDPAVVGTNFGLAILTVLLFYLAATVLNGVVKENYDTIQGWFKGISRRLKFLDPSRLTGGLLKRKPIAGACVKIIVIVAICALIYWFLNPYFTDGLNGIALYISLAIGIAVATYSYEGIQFLVGRRFSLQASIRIFPVAILVAVICVVLSRVIQFHPGLLFGFVGAYTAIAISKKQRAVPILFGAVAVLGISLAAFYLRGLLYNLSWREGDFWRYLVEDTLVATIAIGLEGLVFSLMPLNFLEGGKIRTWNFWIWFGLASIATFIFYYIIINHDNKLVDAVSNTKQYVMYLLIGLLFAVSLGLMFYFKLTRKGYERV